MPQSKKPRKRYQNVRNQQQRKHDHVMQHNHCPVIVRRYTSGPHAAELYCTAHQVHICWIRRQHVELWEEALMTSPSIASEDKDSNNISTGTINGL